MSKITFENSTLSAVERHGIIRQFLAENKIAMVHFTKVDGSERRMPCTLSSDIIPPTVQESSANKPEKKINHEVLSVWCTDAGAWRSFKTMNVISIMPYSTTYTAEVAEDPADPDSAILEFPPEMLEAVGWKEGDVLNWIDNGNGSFTLTKKETQ